MNNKKLEQDLQSELEACKEKYTEYCVKVVQAGTQGEKERARNMRYYTTGKIDAIKMVLATIKYGEQK